MRRASDILSKWVGGTEQNLARAFDQAERDDAVLILDEVDSLLFQRELAQRSWEVSATNELLTQMERFSGILICTTNRLEGLDAASLRRFAVKLRLGVLTRRGRVLLYERLLAPLAAGSAGTALMRELEALSGLTAGDFGVVRSVAALEEGVSHAELVRALGEELRVRAARGGRRAGFGVE